MKGRKISGLLEFKWQREIEEQVGIEVGTPPNAGHDDASGTQSVQSGRERSCFQVKNVATSILNELQELQNRSFIHLPNLQSLYFFPQREWYVDHS